MPINHGHFSAHAAKPPLNHVVEYFWQVNRYNSDFRREVIVPKGIVEIIFNFLPETKFSTKLYDRNFDIPKCFIQGYHNGPITLQLPQSQFLFGVVLKTASVKSLLWIPPGEFANQCIDLTLIDRTFNTLWHQLADEEIFSARVAVFSRWLTVQLKSDLTNARAEAINRLFALEAPTPLSVPAISEWLCLTPRHLSRICYQLAGMNAARTLLYLKYKKAMALIHHSNLRLTEIAHDCEFTDQAHFNKTFKAFTLLTPGQYWRRKSEIPAHYFENVR